MHSLRHWIKLGCLVFVFLLIMIQVSAQSTSEEVTVQVIQDVLYYEGNDADSVRHTLDIYMPEDESVSPVVMYVHGGAWVGGSKKGYANIGQALAKAGLSCRHHQLSIIPCRHPSGTCGRSGTRLCMDSRQYRRLWR